MPRPAATRKPTLRKPAVRKRKTTVRKKKTLPKRKTIARKKILPKRKTIARKKTLPKRKTIARKKTLPKRKTIARKKTLTKRKTKASTTTVRQPRLSKVEAQVATLSADHRITRAYLKETAANQKKADARGDKLDARIDRLVKASIENRKAAANENRKTANENRKTASENRKASIEIRKAVSETKKTVRETSKTISRMGKKISHIGKTLGDVENRWGEFVEALLVGEAHKVINGYQGIKVGPIAPAFPVECDGKERELDGVCFGADMVVVIEAKSRLREGHIGKFIGNVLQRFTEMMPAFRGKKIYGAVGYLNADSKTIEFAQKKGLIVLRTVHKTKEIVGEESKFKLRNFHP